MSLNIPLATYLSILLGLMSSCVQQNPRLTSKVLTEPVFGKAIDIEWRGSADFSVVPVAKRYGPGELRYRMKGQKDFERVPAKVTSANGEVIVFETTIPPIKPEQGNVVEYYFSGSFDRVPFQASDRGGHSTMELSVPVEIESQSTIKIAPQK
jgi:hypothetical protein